jgi:hypothetical protein
MSQRPSTDCLTPGFHKVIGRDPSGLYASARALWYAGRGRGVADGVRHKRRVRKGDQPAPSRTSRRFPHGRSPVVGRPRGRLHEARERSHGK